jgi:hypothetical protein
MIDNGKTNNMGKRQYLGCMRHKEVLFCSQGALAQYLFHRFHLARHPWPDFKSPSGIGSTQRRDQGCNHPAALDPGDI